MQITDQFFRKINYLRVSVTDRCDLRCVYCMKEKMNFLPKSDVLSLEEIERLCDNFIELGVEKIRLTGYQNVLAVIVCFIPFFFGFLLPFMQLCAWFAISYEEIIDEDFLTLLHQTITLLQVLMK